MTPIVLDLSHHNAIPGNYNDLVAQFRKFKAAGIVGIIHKATEGTLTVDNRFATRRQAAFEAGLLWGSYHFLKFGSIPQQAKHYIDTADPAPDNLVALDHESTATLAEVTAFLKYVEIRLGRKAVLYSGATIKEQLGTRVDPYLGSHRLWLAQYSPTAKVQASWSTYWLWQYSDEGQVGGISPIDVSTYQGSATALAAEWSGGPLAAIPDVPVSDAIPPVKTPIQPPQSLLERVIAFLQSLFGKG